MNVELLESVRQTILGAPERFCAAQWAFARNGRRVLQGEASPKDFQCCIAGHVLLRSGMLNERQLLLEGGFHTGGCLWERAASALGIDDQRGRELFFPSQWDQPYKQKYYLCSQEAEAEVAAAYLDYFIEKYQVSPPSGIRAERAPLPKSAKLRPKRALVPS